MRVISESVIRARYRGKEMCEKVLMEDKEKKCPRSSFLNIAAEHLSIKMPAGV